jgi:acyl-CoA synthetase (AMP-forming)/AMP-acid ligase II
MLVHRLLAAGVDSISAGYGMTECDSIACATTAQGMEAVATTVGKPEDGVDVRIVDDHGNTVDSGDSGEIWIGGYTVTRGYFEDEVRTAQDITDDGWLKSGDLGRWTQEGLLQILGRKKEIIIVHGYTLYPAEIENILLQSNLLDAVAVIGVPHPVAGEQCVAFIVPADAHQFDLRALKSWARAHIADYKVPTRFLLIDGIPMNENKKVDQVALRNQAL